MTAVALRHGRFWTWCGVGFVLLVAFLSLTPAPLDAPALYGFKLGHVVAYAWLMLWFAQIHRSARARLHVAIALCAMGVALECLQALTTYRTFAYDDMADNALGVAAGWVLGATALGGALAAFETLLAMISRRR